MDTRGTQTDLVTDRNIADCLMELKSSAEFQDLTYRLSRSCTGEMTLTVTRDSSVGLLGVPFDPAFATVTASGLCYFSVLFTPVEVTNLKPNGDLNLRKFRHILWKLTGRAGYGFCPGFKDSDFPEGFSFEGHSLEVLKQPFTRVQAKDCQVFLQLKRSSSRAVSQPLGLQLCSMCLKALSDIHASVKRSGEDLCKYPAFAKFLPAHSHPAGLKNHSVGGGSSMLKEGDDHPDHCGKAGHLTAEEAEEDLCEDGNVSIDSPNLCVASECEVVTEHSNVEKPKVVKSSSRQLPVKDCRVLLDRFIPGKGPHDKAGSKSKMMLANGSISADSSPLGSPSSHSFERASSGASCHLDLAFASSSASCSLVSSSSAPVTSNGSTRHLKQMASENCSKPVLSARIKPFRTVAPQGQDITDLISADCMETDVALAAGSTDVLTQREEKVDKENPPVLSPETYVSPADSPQPLLIDEEADPDDLESASSEPDTKRPCYRCSLCEEGFQTEAELQEHFTRRHPQEGNDVSQSVTLESCDLVTDEAMHSDSESPRWKVCPVCRNSYGTKEQLEAHLTERHRTRLHRCRFCGQKFALKKNLADHLERHRGSKRLTCTECGSTFSKKKDFAAHVREHMGSLPYFCTVCSKLFSRESVYEEHMERHRAKRGVRAVLSGNEKTLQGIVTKAKRCLEERALLAPLSTSTTSATTLVNNVTKVSTADSLSTSTSESVAIPPSNLHLLSAVSLAQAERDRQTTVDSRRPSDQEEMSAGLMKSSHAAAQRQHFPSSAKLETAASPVDSLEDSKQTAVIVKQGTEEAGSMIQKLNSVLKESQPPSAASPEQTSPSDSVPTHSSTTSSQHSADTGQAPTNTDPSSGQPQPDADQPPGGGGAQGGSTKEKLLVEREERLRQKERELREREQDITRKNMLFFQQLLLAQMSHQPKNGSGAPAVSGEQCKGDKPGPQQAAVMAAIKNLAARGGGLPMPRPPHPGAEVKSGQAPLPFLGGQLPVPVPPELARQELELGKSFSLAHSVKNASPGRSSVPSGKTQTSCSQAGPMTPSNSLLPHATAPGPRPSVVSPRQGPLHPASPRLPPHPAGVRMPHRSPVGSPRSPSTSTAQARPPAPLPRKDGFLDLLMGLESKMPASVREFMPPPPPPRPRLSRPHQPAGPADQGAGLVLHAETPETMARVLGGKGKGRWPRPKGPDGDVKRQTPAAPGGSEAASKKQSRWSGGLVKEQVNSVVTMVPPAEMKRLLSLTKSLSPAPTPTSEGAAPSNSTASLASPRAHSPVASSRAGSSGQPSPTAPSPGHNTQGPPSITSTGSPASHTSSTRSPSPRSMPRLVPAAALAAASSQIMPWLPKSSAPPELEETGPIDLTKGSSGKRAAPEKRPEDHRPEGEEAQQSVVLQHIHLDPAVSHTLSPPARQSIASGRSTSSGMVASSGLNAQAAALQAQLQASLQAAFRFKSQGNSGQQGFVPGAQQLPLAAPQSMESATSTPTEPVQVRAGQPPPLPGFAPRLMPYSLLSGGRLAPPTAGIHSPPERAPLPAPRFHPRAPVSFAPPLSRATHSPSSSTVQSSSGLPPSSLASPQSAVLMPGAAAGSPQGRILSASVTSALTSPPQLGSPPHPIVSPPRSTIPNFLIPEGEGTAQGLKRAGHTEEESKPAVNPLGGFAWHRPAVIDPFLTTDSNTAAANLEGVRGERQGQSEEAAIDLSEDQNLWQQQFLQTLREKRRQQHEQQFMQQQRQQALATNHHLLQNGAPPAKRGRRPKKNAAEAIPVEGGATHYTGSIDSRHALSLAGASTSDIIAAQAQASTAKRPRAKAGRGRPRGRPRKNTAQHIMVEAAVEPPRTEVEEGMELQGLGSRVEVKVEPLEAGVTCDACSTVLYSESEILEHDCDAQ